MLRKKEAIVAIQQRCGRLSNFYYPPREIFLVFTKAGKLWRRGSLRGLTLRFMSRKHEEARILPCFIVGVQLLTTDLIKNCSAFISLLTGSGLLINSNLVLV